MSDDLYSAEFSNSETEPTNIPEFTVSELAFSLKRTVEDSFGQVRVRGELSGLKKAASGHLYFALKDDKAVLDGVCWRTTASRISVELEDGLEVVCIGKLSTYPARSRYQIIVETIEPAGIGALMALLEERRKKLQAEGLFDEERKHPLPYLPNTIGVITSPTGAVIRDILHRLEERFPSHVLLWPVMVQGQGSVEQIEEAIRGFDSLDQSADLPRPDVLILARGGGSIEDLWSFNEEAVIRAVAACKIPVISAVGHETDTTLVDHVADRRAPTPTAAAEIAVPVRHELTRDINEWNERLTDAMDRSLASHGDNLRGLGRGLPDPEALVGLGEQRTDDMAERLRWAVSQHFDRLELHARSTGRNLRAPREIIRERTQYVELRSDRMRTTVFDVLKQGSRDMARTGDRLTAISFDDRLDEAAVRIETSAERLRRGWEVRDADWRRRLEAGTALLESLSHRRVLERGYVLVRAGSPPQIMRQASAAREQTLLHLEFSDGGLQVVPADEAPEPKPSSTRPPSAKRRSQGELF